MTFSSRLRAFGDCRIIILVSLASFIGAVTALQQHNLKYLKDYFQSKLLYSFTLQLKTTHIHFYNSL